MIDGGHVMTTSDQSDEMSIPSVDGWTELSVPGYSDQIPSIFRSPTASHMLSSIPLLVAPGGSLNRMFGPPVDESARKKMATFVCAYTASAGIELGLFEFSKSRQRRCKLFQLPELFRSNWTICPISSF